VSSVLSLADARAVFVARRAATRLGLESLHPDVVHYSTYSEYMRGDTKYRSVYYRPDYDTDVTIIK
jgi:hypothetical protein